MHFRMLTALAFAAALVAGAAQAQDQAKPNPLDAIPEQMPFAQPYGPPISLGAAKAVIAAAEKEARSRHWGMNIAIYDSGANLVAFERMDGAQLASVSIAEHKARAAVLYRRETKIFENAIQLGGFHYVTTLDDVIASRGGIPLVRNGKIIGSVGCSGGTGSQDEVIAKAGAAVINK